MAVNAKKCKSRTLDQCKDKIRRMKEEYTKAKTHNKDKTGVNPIFCPFYDVFDEMIGCRDVIKMPKRKRKSDTKFDKFLTKSVKLGRRRKRQEEF